MFLYWATIFISAFLLFQVQPIIAKQVTPWFGGSASVWTTCMVFFQIVLLLGYLYAHALVRHCSARWQSIIHLAALTVSLIWLPVIPDEAWKPTSVEEPALQVLGVLLATVGLPYFVLSTTGPLVQAWYYRLENQSIPYRLFALSNLASLAGLLAYPFVLEPLVATMTQARGWSAGYMLFFLFCSSIAWRARGARSFAAAGPGDAREPESADRPGPRQMLIWLTLAAFPSYLLLAVTNHVTQNIASAPFFWLAPLVVYLLSFVLCFDRDGWYQPIVWIPLLALSLAAYGFFFLHPEYSLRLRLLFAVFVTGLFVCCMFAHGELARRKPHPRYLTVFYLMVSVGGALGGFLVSVIAPVVLAGYHELPIGVAAFGVFVMFLLYRKSLALDLAWAGLCAFLVMTAVSHLRSYQHETISSGRNFYGSLRVTEEAGKENGEPYRTMTHGTVAHGNQFLSAALRDQPTAYYGATSGVGRILAAHNGSRKKVGVVGLGAGTLATYGVAGDVFRFYEINPMVLEFAQDHFTFLADSAAEIEVALGDGRLLLESEPDARFDLLVIDAFSGDSIPVHLLTLEAFQVYFERLKPDGVLGLHISNYNLDLAPVVAKAADSLGYPGIIVEDPGDQKRGTAHSIWALVARTTKTLNGIAGDGAGKPLPSVNGFRPWTDDYSNLLQVIR